MTSCNLPATGIIDLDSQITHFGIQVGKPLTDLRGIPGGTPEYTTGDKR